MTSTPTPKSLRKLLAEQLPRDVDFNFYHYSTPPTKSSALFSAPPTAKSERTYCESHLLAASIKAKDELNPSLPEELLVLAIEVLVYTTRKLTTVFVSKADSTGYLAELQLPRAQSGSPLKVICGTFVSWLAGERRREGKKLVISLFARAQDQYLFPASIDNKNKHVLDDRGLVKWWCKVLDPIVWQYKAETERKPFAERLTDDAATCNGSTPLSEATAKGYLVIPGFDPYDTLRYVPPVPVANTPRRWAATHPLFQIAPHAAAPPRCLVPHFPDDPKARFLDELDEELPDRGTDAMVADGGTPSRSNGMWKSVKTLDQFWEFMAFRQECSSGRIVGFVWVVITPLQPSIPEEDEEEPSQQSISQSFAQVDLQESISSPRKRPNNAPENSPYYVWPSESRGTICFSNKDYDRAHEVLIQQNFGTRASTAKATRRWKEEIAVLGGVDQWGWKVTGRKEPANSSERPIANGVTPVTVMGVRKKRKPEAATNAPPSEGAQSLESGLVRKKPKVEAAPVPEASTNGVNTLSTGLVRKKPKAL
ncbi:hypothetical protein EK21DRAFT_80397 [Setomelanomma holmii]|uniref:histone acetyltransferase n=1 Tax=Setomelanomma holmii TaxID=210430 RepID=A0A9P4GVG9_9PLEO|nr:hypothetical protein EK21DRAFT_80397 [Setomelanomma holmii]